MYHDKTRYYPDYEGWRLEAELWYDGDDIDPDDCDDDAFDALCNLPERELEAYLGDAVSEPEPMEV